MANILANVKKYIRGKFARKWRIYGEWAYECNSPPIAMIANDRQTFVGVRKHSRSFTANSSTIIRLSRRITEKRGHTNGYECLRISYESLRISYEAYDYLTISVANFLSKNRNRFDLFVMDSQAFATFYLQKILANPYECLTNVFRSLQMPCHQ